jgi:hypothetical protein
MVPSSPFDQTNSRERRVLLVGGIDTAQDLRAILRSRGVSVVLAKKGSGRHRRVALALPATPKPERHSHQPGEPFAILCVHTNPVAGESTLARSYPARFDNR